MQISERAYHGFRTMVRKSGRLDQEQKARLCGLLEPNLTLIHGNKANAEALPEQIKTAFNAAVMDEWIKGMEAALEIFEAMIENRLITVVPDSEGEERDNHDKSHSLGTGCIRQ